MTLEAIRYRDGVLEILNQLALPSRTEYERVDNVEDAWKVIRSMKVSIQNCIYDLSPRVMSLPFLDVSAGEGCPRHRHRGVAERGRGAEENVVQ